MRDRVVDLKKGTNGAVKSIVVVGAVLVSLVVFDWP